jgi:hypothetical protein
LRSTVAAASRNTATPTQVRGAHAVINTTSMTRCCGGSPHLGGVHASYAWQLSGGNL